MTRKNDTPAAKTLDTTDGAVCPILPDNDRQLRIIPLGGLGEIGMNITVFKYNDVMFAIDCGQMLPDAEQLGVDMVIPDFKFILENKDKFRAVFLTHAHEDHIGALPYLLREINIPVYGSRLTIEILRARLKEYRLAVPADLHIIEQDELVELSKQVKVEGINITHSIMGAMSFVIHLPFGDIVYTGDYKIDPTPLDGKVFDYQAFARLGETGKVVALLADSTNANKEGNSKSEAFVREPLDRLFSAASGKIIFSTFSSSLHRIQMVIELARKYGRKVVPYGLNMERNTHIAADLGMLRYAKEIIVSPNTAKNIPHNKLVLLCTGSQGEPMSALNRLAMERHQDFKVYHGDTVILSARFIPGNERAIYRTINNLYRLGARVFYDKNTPGIHVSGHAYRDEMCLMLRLTNPKYLVPVHGEIRHLVEHCNLALSMGFERKNILIMRNGNMLIIGPKGISRGPDVPCGRKLVDGNADIGGVDDVILRDRLELANDGILFVVLAVDNETGALLNTPDIVSRGFLFKDEHTDELFEECARVAAEVFAATPLEDRGDRAVFKTSLRRTLKKLIKQKTGRFPVILPVIMEV